MFSNFINKYTIYQNFTPIEVSKLLLLSQKRLVQENQTYNEILRNKARKIKENRQNIFNVQENRILL